MAIITTIKTLSGVGILADKAARDDMPPFRQFNLVYGFNGSGKSTIKDRVPPHLIYTYVNADELQKEAVATGAVDLTPFGITTTTEDIQAFFGAHGLCAMAGFADHLHQISFDGTGVRFGNKVNAYHASVVADFIRQQLLAKRESFTFETVMSSRDKVDFMRQAQEQGYRT